MPLESEVCHPCHLHPKIIHRLLINNMNTSFQHKLLKDLYKLLSSPFSHYLVTINALTSIYSISDEVLILLH